MKTLAGLLVVTLFIAHSAGYLIKVPTTSTATPMLWTGHTQWMLQKMMLPLFENVCETSSNPNICRLAQEFTFDSTEYLEPEVISNLQKRISTGLLPKGTIFSEYDVDHMNELKIVYEVLHNAKDFDVFYKAAAWARQNLNCALYVNAIYMAIQSRRDTERLSIPAPYELLPNYFIDKNVIIQASSILAGEEITHTDAIREEGNGYTIDANYTALFYNNDDDSKLAYFREDIGLNSYYFLRKLRLAPWFNDDVNGNFGEHLYQMMKQLMARYNLERYANGFSELDSINWDSVMNIPYDPKLIYSDGNEFAHRTLPLELTGNDDLALLKTIENNIVTVVSHMHQNGYNKTQILNHLMEILVTSDRSYETLARQLLGKDLTNNGLHCSTIEHYLTSLRDPMFWKINNKIVDMIDEALRILPSYTRNELYFPGVEVVNIDVKKMMTACDYFEFDVTDALKMEESSSTFRIKVGQPRLNHKEFLIRVNVSSLVSEKGVVKIYLGPKFMPGEQATKKNLFTLLDVFEVNLKVGSNIITRSSDSMIHFSEDFMLLNTIRKKVEDAQFGLDSLPLTTIQSQIGYPSRLILPKGTPQGLPLQIFVFIAPYMKASLSDSYSRNSMEFNSAILSPGYPLDLMIEDWQLFGLPNAMIKHVMVTQKSDSKVENYGGPGIAKSWYTTDSYDSSSRPNYNTNYGVNDYTVKVNEFNVDVNKVATDEYFTDEFYVIGLDDKPYLLKQSNSEPKVKAPFDYKAKKAQYDKKDYSTQKKYPKYDTKTKVVDEITLPVVEETSTDRMIDVFFDKKIEGSEINIVKDIKVADDNVTQTDLSEEEVLPIPAMLKKDIGEEDQFNYKAKKRERDYKIKMKKNYLDKLIKYAKKKNFTKIHTFEVTDKLVPEIKPYVTEPEMGKVMLTKDDTFLGKTIDSGVIPKLTSNPAEIYADTEIDYKNIEDTKDITKSKLVWKKPDILKDIKIVKDITMKPMYKPTVMPDVQNAVVKEIVDEKDHKSDPIVMDIKTVDTTQITEDVTTVKIDVTSLNTENLVADIFKVDVDTDKDTVATDFQYFDPQENLAKFILSKESIEFNNHITKDDVDIEKRAEITHTDVIQRDSEEKDPVILIEVVEERAPEMYDYIMRSVNTDNPKLIKQ